MLYAKPSSNEKGNDSIANSGDFWQTNKRRKIKHVCVHQHDDDGELWPAQGSRRLHSKLLNHIHQVASEAAANKIKSACCDPCMFLLCCVTLRWGQEYLIWFGGCNLYHACSRFTFIVRLAAERSRHLESSKNSDWKINFWGGSLVIKNSCKQASQKCNGF